MSAPNNNQRHESPSSSPSKIKDSYAPSDLSYIIMFVVLGASAGMTMYTRRTGQMMSRMNQYTENQLKRNPPKFGPPTRAEFEKMRNRWGDSD